MVEITYQDYLKYKKYLGSKEDIANSDEIEKTFNYVTYAIKLLRAIDKEENSEEMLNEESARYRTATKEQIQNHQQHDKLFRDLLNNKSEFVDFIKDFVDKDSTLTKEKLEKYNRSFITSDYKSRNSDIVYKIKDKNVYFLVEHQSRVNYAMPYRIMEYCYEIIRDVTDKEKITTKEFEMPKVIPIVLYTGNRKWNIPDYIKESTYKNFKDMGIKLKYMTIDINNYNKKELLNCNSMVAYAMQLERISSSQEIQETVNKILKMRGGESREVKRTISYALKGKICSEELNKLFEEIKEGKVEKSMVTIRERIAEIDRKTYEKGRREGREEAMVTIRERIAEIDRKTYEKGRREERILVAQKLLKTGMKEKDVIEIIGLNKKETEKLKN